MDVMEFDHFNDVVWIRLANADLCWHDKTDYATKTCTGYADSFFEITYEPVSRSFATVDFFEFDAQAGTP